MRGAEGFGGFRVWRLWKRMFAPWVLGYRFRGLEG